MALYSRAQGSGHPDKSTNLSPSPLFMKTRTASLRWKSCITDMTKIVEYLRFQNPGITKEGCGGVWPNWIVNIMCEWSKGAKEERSQLYLCLEMVAQEAWSLFWQTWSVGWGCKRSSPTRIKMKPNWTWTFGSVTIVLNHTAPNLKTILENRPFRVLLFLLLLRHAQGTP